MGLDFDALEYCKNLKGKQSNPPYACPVSKCDRSYKSLIGLQYHLVNFHDNPQPITPVITPNRKKSRARGGHHSTPKSGSCGRAGDDEQGGGSTGSGGLKQTVVMNPENLVTYNEAEGTVQFNKDGKSVCLNVDEPLPFIDDEEYEDLVARGCILNPNAPPIETNAPWAKVTVPEARYYEIEDYNVPDAPPRPLAYYRFIEKSAEELDAEIEYDVDEEDTAWLEYMNEQREKSGLNGVSIDTMELLMDRLEKESYFQAAANGIATGVEVDDDAVCCICMDGECQNTNVILFCDMCNLAVHQDCYGVPYIPEGQWLCRRCLQSPSTPVNCVLCPNTGGAFKQTDRGQWAHVVCALWIPEVRFANTVFLEPIDSIETIPPARWRLTCYVCKEKGLGACIQCQRNSCYAAFHVTCAQQAGLYMTMDTVKDGHNDSSVHVQKYAYCHAHTPADAKLKTNEKEVEDTRHKMKEARKALAKKRSSAPVVLIPTIPSDRVQEIAGMVHMQKKQQFLDRLIAYWTLKRKFRNGVPLLRRLQSQGNHHGVIHRSGIEGSPDTDELYKQLKYWQCLRQDLERARLLCELVRKREKLKAAYVKICEQCVMLEINPLESALTKLLDALEARDTSEIFREPVDTNEVPDYLDIVTHPMDLGTMREKLKSGEYSHLDQLEADFDLMIQNCLAYNNKDTVFYRAGIRMRDQAAPLFTQVREELERGGLLDKIETEQRDHVEQEIDEELKQLLAMPASEKIVQKLLILADKSQVLKNPSYRTKKIKQIRLEITRMRKALQRARFDARYSNAHSRHHAQSDDGDEEQKEDDDDDDNGDEADDRNDAKDNETLIENEHQSGREGEHENENETEDIDNNIDNVDEDADDNDNYEVEEDDDDDDDEDYEPKNKKQHLSRSTEKLKTHQQKHKEKPHRNHQHHHHHNASTSSTKHKRRQSKLSNTRTAVNANDEDEDTNMDTMSADDEGKVARDKNSSKPTASNSISNTTTTNRQPTAQLTTVAPVQTPPCSPIKNHNSLSPVGVNRRTAVLFTRKAQAALKGRHSDNLTGLTSSRSNSGMPIKEEHNLSSSPSNSLLMPHTNVGSDSNNLLGNVPSASTPLHSNAPSASQSIGNKLSVGGLHLSPLSAASLGLSANANLNPTANKSPKRSTRHKRLSELRNSSMSPKKSPNTPASLLTTAVLNASAASTSALGTPSTSDLSYNRIPDSFRVYRANNQRDVSDTDDDDLSDITGSPCSSCSGFSISGSGSDYDSSEDDEDEVDADNDGNHDDVEDEDDGDDDDDDEDNEKHREDNDDDDAGDDNDNEKDGLADQKGQKHNEYKKNSGLRVTSKKRGQSKRKMAKNMHKHDDENSQLADENFESTLIEHANTSAKSKTISGNGDARITPTSCSDSENQGDDEIESRLSVSRRRHRTPTPAGKSNKLRGGKAKGDKRKSKNQHQQLSPMHSPSADLPEQHTEGKTKTKTANANDRRSLKSTRTPLNSKSNTNHIASNINSSSNSNSNNNKIMTRASTPSINNVSLINTSNIDMISNSKTTITTTTINATATGTATTISNSSNTAICKKSNSNSSNNNYNNSNSNNNNNNNNNNSGCNSTTSGGNVNSNSDSNSNNNKINSNNNSNSNNNNANSNTHSKHKSKSIVANNSNSGTQQKMTNSFAEESAASVATKALMKSSPARRSSLNASTAAATVSKSKLTVPTAPSPLTTTNSNDSNSDINAAAPIAASTAAPDFINDSTTNCSNSSSSPTISAFATSTNAIMKPPLEPLQLVWAKCRGYPWYPALILDPKTPKGFVYNGVPLPAPPTDVLALRKNYPEDVLFLVLFFDAKRTWQWLPESKLEILGIDKDLDQQKLIESRKPTERKAVKKAYQDALHYQSQVSDLEGQGPDPIM